MAKAGERVLTEEQNSNFEQLVRAWSPSGGAGGDTRLDSSGIEDRLYRIETAIKDGFAKPSPVTIDNTEDMARVGRDTALAAQASDAGAAISEKQVTEGLGFHMGLSGVGV
jgi:hypothetical protein